MIGTITVTSTGLGIDIVDELQRGWFTIQAQDAVNNTITIETEFTNSTPNATTTGGGTGNYLAVIKEADKNHEAQDGVVARNVTLRSQTDAQSSRNRILHKHQVHSS